MKAWSVNWKTNCMEIEVDEGTKVFHCQYSPKLVHEFLGGYIFMSMRSLDRNEALDSEMFFKLTGGWVS